MNIVYIYAGGIRFEQQQKILRTPKQIPTHYVKSNTCSFKQASK